MVLHDWVVGTREAIGYHPPTAPLSLWVSNKILVNYPSNIIEHRRNKQQLMFYYVGPSVRLLEKGGEKKTKASIHRSLELACS